MDFRQLRTFTCVAELGSLSKASDTLRIAQPALSRQIQHLEREVGTALFTRVGRTARLTVAGKVFLDHARRLLDMAEAAATAARRAGEGVVGRLAVGFVSPATYRRRSKVGSLMPDAVTVSFPRLRSGCRCR